jgi:transposase
MTLCFSRHWYVEIAWDQTMATWLGCHHRAFEWFAAVPARVIIDNAKFAIIKACFRDPQVQPSYADYKKCPQLSVSIQVRQTFICYRRIFSQNEFSAIRF